jgi:GNAT superfamily N-acetyltransferase
VTLVRTATEADVDAIAALVQSAYRGDASRAGWTTEADLLDGRRTDADLVRELVDAPDSLVLAVDDDLHPGELLACCHLERRGRSAYLGMLAVRPGRQGSGVGSALTTAAAEQARRWGCARMQLTVLNHRPELVAWYERRGFAMTGQAVPFPAYGDERYGIPRRTDLVLLEMARPLEPTA